MSVGTNKVYEATTTYGVTVEPPPPFHEPYPAHTSTQATHISDVPNQTVGKEKNGYAHKLFY